MRLDLYLTDKGFFNSRSKAQAAIKNKSISINDKIVDKPSFEVEETDMVKVLFDSIRYVSRGGYKLEGAIKEFGLDFKDKIVLDIGASTGGFSDCAIQNGAKLVYAVDVGSAQLDESLKQNPKVVSFENTNILDLNLDIAFDFLVMDVSFVSIIHLIPAIKKYLNKNNVLVCLIKPQFEAGKMIGKGVIKDKKTHLAILDDVYKKLKNEGLYINKIAPSMIKGGSGNIEFVSLISLFETSKPQFSEVVEKAWRSYKNA